MPGTKSFSFQKTDVRLDDRTPSVLAFFDVRLPPQEIELRHKLLAAAPRRFDRFSGIDGATTSQRSKNAELRFARAALAKRRWR